MNKFSVLSAGIIFLLLVVVGCSSSNPIAPESNPNLALDASQNTTGQSTEWLWGYYDVYLDIDTQEATIVPNRNAMLIANVLFFLNNQPASLAISFNGTNVSPGNVEVDLDVTITHPIPGLTKFNGYDVKGIFIGNGSGVMEHNDALTYAVPGVDQLMMDDPVNDDGGGPDGYTRWFNPVEFAKGGLFSYIPGNLATVVDNPATINPYKLFTDGLTAHEDAWEYQSSVLNNNVFSSGAINTRNYYIWCPVPNPGIKFAYAISASWINGATHPANAVESSILTVTVTDDVYYTSPTFHGGDLILDFDVWSWDIGLQPLGITVESSVLSVPYIFDSTDMIPVGGGTTWSTYHVEIPADNILGTAGNEFWLILNYPEYGYIHGFTQPGGAPDDPLQAFFRRDLNVLSAPINDPICELVVVTPMPFSNDLAEIEFDASGSYDPDGTNLTFHWDFNGNGIYDEDPADSYTGTPENPIHTYTSNYFANVCLWIENENTGESTCCEQIDVTIPSSVTTLYLYDGMIDDGGIVDGTWTWIDPYWEYCPSINAWNEYGCENYPDLLFSICRTPYIDFPDTGTFDTIHLYIWHWGNMPDDGSTFGDVGIGWDYNGTDIKEPNFYYDRLTNIGGSDFNDPVFPYFIGTFGSAATPEWSHFDASEYAGKDWAIALTFEETSGTSGNAYEGWNVRKIWVYYD